MPVASAWPRSCARRARPHSTERQFGEVSQRFFGDFLSRVLSAERTLQILNRAAEQARRLRRHRLHQGAAEGLGGVLAGDRCRARLREVGPQAVRELREECDRRGAVRRLDAELLQLRGEPPGPRSGHEGFCQISGLVGEPRP